MRAAGDLNGDGFGDLIGYVPSPRVPEIPVIFANGYWLGAATGMSAPVRMPSTNSLASTSFGDVDNDGYSDLVAVDFGDLTPALSVRVAYGAPLPWNFMEPAGTRLGYQLWSAALLADWDRTGYDVALVMKGQEPVVQVGARFPGMRPVVQTVFSPSGYPYSAELGDVNGDGIPEIVASLGCTPSSIVYEPCENYPIVAIERSSDGAYTEQLRIERPQPLSEILRVRSIFGLTASVPGDLDGDGRDEIVALNFALQSATTPEGFTPAYRVIYRGGTTIAAATVQNPTWSGATRRDWWGVCADNGWLY